MTMGRQSLRDNARREIGRLCQRQFLEASMAVGALVAVADGVAEASERTRLDSLLEEISDLAPFASDEAVALYERHLEALREDGDTAKQRILALVGRFADDAAAARTLLWIGIEIGKSDAVFERKEYGALQDLADALGVDLSSLSG